MDSQDIFLNNINRLAAYHSLDTYKQMAEFLDVTEDALKHWQNKTRCPTLKRLDQIGDRIGCRSYALIQKDSEIFAKIDCNHIDTSFLKVYNPIVGIVEIDF